MNKWAFVFLVAAVLGSIAVFLPVLHFMAEEEKTVPFKTNVEDVITIYELPLEITELQTNDPEVKEKIGDAILIADYNEFLSSALEVADDEVIRKIFITGGYRDNYLLPARHVYWFEAFDGRAILSYEEHYTKPKTSLPHGDIGSFSHLTDDEVVFKYQESLYVVIGTFAWLIGLIIVGVLLLVIRIRSWDENQPEEM